MILLTKYGNKILQLNSLNEKKLMINFFRITLILSMLMFSVSVKADNQPTPPSLYTNGQGEVFVKPDIGELVLGIEADAKTASEAQTKASAVLSGFIGQLKDVGIQPSEIRTVEASLNPVRDYNAKPAKIISYAAIQQVRVRVKGEDRLKLISRAVDVATKNSINRIDSVGFSVSSERQTEAQKKAYALAAADAISSAKDTLASLGLKYNRVKEIHLSSTNYNNYYPAPVYRKAMPEAMMAADAAPEISNITPGEASIKANVSMTVEFDN
jgi:uncharacterized protein YggE